MRLEMLITGDQLMPEREDENLGKDKQCDRTQWLVIVGERERRGGEES